MSDKAAVKILPHDDLEELAPGLWSVTGRLPFPLKRNMTVYRMKDGTLLLHSVIALNDAGLARLDSLGKPSVMIVPSTGHRMDAPFYKSRYPALRVLAPAAARAKVEQVIAVDATCEEALPALGIAVHPLPMYRTGELAYEVAVPGGGKALILCDAVANADHPPGLGGALMAAIGGGIKGRLGVPRLVRYMLLRDKAAGKQALARLADIPDLRVVTVAHGRPVVGDCRGALQDAVASL
jgi:hypothetical protein